MKTLSIFGAIALSVAVLFSSCGASNTVKGTGIGAGAGAALGAGIGAIIGGGKGAAWGAGIGTVVGGGAGAIIGNKMDKQKEELEKINNAQVESINDGQALKVTFESGILFATNSSTLSSAAQTSLSAFATSLRNNPDTDIQIFGHTDSTGNDKINNPLSEKRAAAVYAFLQNKGISGNRMESQGMGSTQPIADNSTKAGQAQNRRVEVYILPNEKMIQDAQQGR
ncbi:outer membrane protein OmpA-like peptidoglycan-associated protein [Dysgonomonas sp. PH5-45]|uniref:OmpA family protein n=1 Tax=unclassified Dysgonomonas TaxID=2630389 RepID=UPI0024730F2F|nr:MULTISPECIES: OmpA family protein [unclassified Dysgonomonas]MDH6354571.1 outer membrane protein OmpA-like peptidoglycan-associated protein [Dysgonomonas sp. PH5-45]MDH6387373.1 outer membrane protein OmpA-like peptidoglycan-associated protein [Dysgonomonas sp. PH5-37]